MKPHHLYWIGFNLVKGVGPSRIRLLLGHFGSLDKAWAASRSELIDAGMSSKLAACIARLRIETDLDQVCRRLQEEGVCVVCWEDADYPRRLREIDQPPPVLYYRGKFSTEDMWAVAVVGTRRATSYGRQVAAELGAFLANNGVTVVSGLARGIDTIAHSAAMSAGGRTLGVLGCGVDYIYPPENRRLAIDMVESGRGMLISDYPVGTLPEGPNFPPRNRIISGLSLAVVVIEAGERSGALITANFALEQGREIFAVPGNITAPQSVGTNRLICNGAHPYIRPPDVLEILEWVRVVQYPERKRSVPDPGVEQSIYALLQTEAFHLDELSIKLALPVDKVSGSLTKMELKGLVRRTDGMKYISV